MKTLTIILFITVTLNCSAQKKQTFQTISGVATGICLNASVINPVVFLPASGVFLLITVCLDSYNTTYIDGEIAYKTILGIGTTKEYRQRKRKEKEKWMSTKTSYSME